jgi:tetratricopeptide (TPR) repeat protein
MIIGLFDDALSFIEEGKKKYPEWEVYGYFWNTFMFKRDVERARQEFLPYTEKYPKAFVTNALFLGISYLVEGRLQKALEEFSGAVESSQREKIDTENFNPYSILAGYLTGVALVKKGDFRAAQDQANAIGSIIQKGNYGFLSGLSFGNRRAERPQGLPPFFIFRVIIRFGVAVR